MFSQVNPNEPSAQTMTYTVPKDPDTSGDPYCLNMGTIAISKNGVPFYSPVTAEVMNAVQGETQVQKEYVTVQSFKTRSLAPRLDPLLLETLHLSRCTNFEDANRL